MSNPVQKSVEAVLRVHEKLGDKGFADISGVAYTTVREAFKRGFPGPSVKTLIKLAEAAHRHEADAVDGQAA